jgi:hypothetical protein
LFLLLNNLVDQETIMHIDALRFYKKYTDLFYMEDVPEAERQATAKQVAEKILSELRSAIPLAASGLSAGCERENEANKSPVSDCGGCPG